MELMGGDVPALPRENVSVTDKSQLPKLLSQGVAYVLSLAFSENPSVGNELEPNTVWSLGFFVLISFLVQLSV